MTPKERLAEAIRWHLEQEHDAEALWAQDVAEEITNIVLHGDWGT